MLFFYKLYFMAGNIKVRSPQTLCIQQKYSFFSSDIFAFIFSIKTHARQNLEARIALK
jgi:hypothetical protein